METGQKNIQNHDELIFWKVPEFDKHERTSTWYIAAVILGILGMIFAFVTANFLFAVIIVITALIIVLRQGQEPDMVKFSISYEGISIGRKFYDYDDISDFSLVYKPKLGVKRLYFEFKSPFQHRLSLPINDISPLVIREILVKYLPENTERTDQSTSEGLANLFKL
jgi:hypothetical protein